jgi:hypothetical protein
MHTLASNNTRLGEVLMAGKKSNLKQLNEQTSAKAASAASKVLKNPKASADERTAAAAALTQARNKRGK